MPDAQETYTILSGREIKLLNRRDSNYPGLSALCLDFEFRVIEMLVTEMGAEQTWGKKYALVTNSLQNSKLTPHFDNLRELEEHCKLNLVELLNQFMESKGQLPGDQQQESSVGG